MEPNEIDDWKKEIIKIGAEPFVTSEIDVEAYFCTAQYIKTMFGNNDQDIEKIKDDVVAGEQDEIIASYVNGRIDIARKAGTIWKVDYGKLSAIGVKKAAENPFDLMKGKRRLAKIRNVFKSSFNLRFDALKDASVPIDTELTKLGAKLFGKTKQA